MFTRKKRVNGWKCHRAQRTLISVLADRRSTAARVSALVAVAAMMASSVRGAAAGTRPNKTLRAQAAKQSQRTVLAGSHPIDLALSGPQTGSAARQVQEDEGAPYGVVVTPDKPTHLEFGGAALDVPAGAVDR